MCRNLFLRWLLKVQQEMYKKSCQNKSSKKQGCTYHSESNYPMTNCGYRMPTHQANHKTVVMFYMVRYCTVDTNSVIFFSS